MATTTNTTPAEMPFRRALLTGTAGAAAALSPFAVARPVHGAEADAGLIALCAAWRQALDVNAVVVDRLSNMHERDWCEADRAEWDETGEAAADLEDRVAETRATTMAGVRAKAAVLDYMAEAYGVPCPAECAASLVADLVGLSA
jgi:hypothetical protein